MPARTSKQLLRRQETRRRLIEAAMAAWARHGYEACAVEAIANEAGVSKGALYFHFRSKEDLLLEVVDLQLWRDQQRVLELASAGGIARMFRALLDPGRTLAETSDPWPRLAQEFWSAGARSPRVAARLHEMYQKRREILSRHLGEQFQVLGNALQIPPDQVCSLVVAAMDGVLVQQALSPATSYRQQGGLLSGGTAVDGKYQQNGRSGDQRGDDGMRPAVAG